MGSPRYNVLIFFFLPPIPMARSTLDRLYSLRPVNTLSVQDRIEMSEPQTRILDERKNAVRTATVVLMNRDEPAGRGNPADSDE